MSYVTVHYGPYESCGVVEHRTLRLRGLQDELEKRGHTVELVPSPHWDRVDVEVCRCSVFRCNIKHLEFEHDEHDVVCARAIEAVEHAVHASRPEFLYPDIADFSADFFDECLVETFKRCEVRENIHKCVSDALTLAEVRACLDECFDNALSPEFVTSLLEEMIEVVLQKDYMLDLLYERLAERYSTEDFMSNAIIDAVRTRDMMASLIWEASLRTHPDEVAMIRDMAGDAADAAVDLCEERLETREEAADIVDGLVVRAIKVVDRKMIAEMLAEIVARVPASDTSLVTGKAT